MQKAQKEIATILPARDEYIVTTSEFDHGEGAPAADRKQNRSCWTKKRGDKPTLRTRTEHAPPTSTDGGSRHRRPPTIRDPDRPVLKKRTDGTDSSGQ